MIRQLRSACFFFFLRAMLDIPAMGARSVFWAFFLQLVLVRAPLHLVDSRHIVRLACPPDPSGGRGIPRPGFACAHRPMPGGESDCSGLLAALLPNRRCETMALSDGSSLFISFSRAEAVVDFSCPRSQA